MNSRLRGSWMPLWAGMLVGAGLPLSAQGVITTFMAWTGSSSPDPGAPEAGFAIAIGIVAFVAGVLLMSAGAASLRGVLRSNLEHRAASGGDGQVVPYVWIRFAIGALVLALAYAVYAALNG